MGLYPRTANNKYSSALEEKVSSSEEALNTVLTIIWKRSAQGGGFVCGSRERAASIAQILNNNSQKDVHYKIRGTRIIGVQVDQQITQPPYLIGSYSEFDKGTTDNIFKEYGLAEITGDKSLAQYALTERYDFSGTIHATEENNLPHLNQSVTDAEKLEKFSAPEDIIESGTSKKTHKRKYADGYKGLGPAHLIDLGWTKKEFDEINQNRTEKFKKKYVNLTKPG